MEYSSAAAEGGAMTLPTRYASPNA